MKKTILIIITLFSFLGLLNTVFALDNRFLFWTGADFSGPFKPKSHWGYNGLIQSRLGDTQNTLGQLVLQPSVKYNFFNGWSAWWGYDYRPTTAINGTTLFLEQRVWPQLQYKFSATPRLKISFRSRLEYRWRNNQPQQSTRFRQRLEFIIVNTNRYGIDFDVFDEVFFNLNHPSWETRDAVGFNWFFVGLVIPVYKYFAIDTGYLNVLQSNSPVNRMGHVFIFMLSTSFDDHVQVPLEDI